MKLTLAAATAAVIVSALPAAASPPAGESRNASIPKATVKSSTDVATEGDRITLRVRVPDASNAKRVVLQERMTDVFGDAVWSEADSKRARSRVVFKRTVTAANEAAYRVAVSYRGRSKPVVSPAEKLTVWRWIELREFSPYFSTSSLVGIGDDAMNGAAYETWGLHYTISSPRAWESRITPGRHCTAFRAVLGLSDRSADSSSGSISFTADDALVYQSPVLTPGMTVPVTLDLARPYRFGLAAANTSPESVRAYPMVGNGALYCTGIAS